MKDNFADEEYFLDETSEEEVSLVDDDEMTPEEEAFLKGYEEANDPVEEEAEEEL